MDSTLSADGLSFSTRLVEQFMFGLVLVDGDNQVRYLNHKARQLLLLPGEDLAGSWSCCELMCNRLFGPLDGTCLSREAARTKGELPEVRIDIETERLQTAAWVTVSRLGPGQSELLFHLRPGKSGDRRRRTEPGWVGNGGLPPGADLTVRTLGRLQVESREGVLSGPWLEQRAGQLLEYLICERRRVVRSDQAAEALWPDTGLVEGQSRLRYNVHVLRERLEPGRAQRSPASFVVSRNGGYTLDTSRVWLDVDEFEREARTGLAAYERMHHDAAGRHLTAALQLYKGDFLTADPYAEWALEEQERLRGLAAQALWALARIELELGRLELAAEHARRLADLDPFDADVQQLVIEICLRRGRRSEAYRRYLRFRKRMVSTFQAEPGFDLRDVERRLGPNGAAPSA